MSRWSILIRCVLSLSLVLNGVGTSAAAHGGLAHATPTQHENATTLTASTATEPASGASAADASAGAKPPCHGGGDAPGTAQSQPGSDQTSASTGHGDSQPKCCHHAGCAGTCLQHSPAAAALWIPMVVVTPRSVSHTAGIMQLLPVRPPLTRPPDA
jgi:hypothetical protein